MDKTSLLFEIKKELEALLGQIQRLEKEPENLHAIDKDLLMEKTRRLYEKMIALKEIEKEEKISQTEQKAAVIPGPPEPQAKPQPDKAPADRPEEEVAVPGPKETATTRPMPQSQPALMPEEPAQKILTEEKPPATEKEETPVAEETPAPETPAPAAAETTLDLFSTAPQETLGETLKPSEKPAIADALQATGISDLREAIGINDKFLFVNELFNGDLERYNKVIDELNSFTGLAGIRTYLIELQVQYQWEENSPAYQKLTAILERKFS